MSARQWFVRSVRGWFGSRRDRAKGKFPNARPQCEALEERVVPATLTHRYDLNGTLTDSMGGPALVSDGGTLDTARYSFGPNQGLRLSGALDDPTDYSLVVKMQLASAAPFFKKIVDFAQRLSDSGLYVTNTNLQLFPGAGGADAIPLGTDFEYALTRDHDTGVAKLYLNGILQQTYGGSVSDVSVATDNVLTFFEDDLITGSTEAGSGSVDFIQLYDGALSDAEVLALANAMNTKPLVLTVDNSSVSVIEGQTATNMGHWDGTSFDTVSLTASVGTVTKNTNGTWSWSYNAADDTGAPTSVTITSTQDNDSLSVTFSLSISNADPVVDPIAGPTSGVRGQAQTFSSRFTDVGTLDTHQVTWNFGDGSGDFGPTSATQGTTIAISHVFTANDTYTVTLTVRDDDGGVTVVSTSITITAFGLQDDPCHPGQTMLVVGGTNGDDTILVTAVGTSGAVAVTMNGVSQGSFAPTSRIVVYAQDGNDDVQVAGSINLSAWLYGGGGNDRLKGGAGNNVLLGGDGDDLLVGGSKRDILIGGRGADRLVGNAEDDILIACSTQFDTDPTALAAILGVWVDPAQAYQQRVTALTTTGVGANQAVKLNSATVFDDGTQDVLTGSSGQDWFFANVAGSGVLDKITGLSAAEFAIDLAFINGL